MKRRRFSPVVFAAVLVVVAAIALDVVASAQGTVYDLTADNSLSLTRQSERAARAVRRDTTITAFLQPDDPERAPAASLLFRYQRLNPHLRARLLDPRRSAGEMRRLGIEPGLGGLALQRGAAVEVAATATEQDITAALVRLARGRRATVCFTTGHGEAAVDDDGDRGLSHASAILAANGYRVETLDLLTTASIPSTCSGVVLASPTSELGPASGELSSWLATGGRLLVLGDPSSAVDLNPVTRDVGLGLRRGIVLEGDPAAVLPDDPTAPIVRRFSSASPIVRRLPPVFFPGLQQVTVGADRPDVGLTLSRLADTSPLSYLETEPLTSTFDPAVDTAGPITVAAAADRARLAGDRIHRSRAVVVGDVDFATNAVIGQAANSTFLVRALDWLTLDEQLTVLSANIPRDRTLVMTASRVTYARFISLGLLPGLFLLAGAFVALVRRSR